MRASNSRNNVPGLFCTARWFLLTSRCLAWCVAVVMLLLVSLLCRSVPEVLFGWHLIVSCKQVDKENEQYRGNNIRCTTGTGTGNNTRLLLNVKVQVPVHNSILLLIY
jgi:hypothetical protein